MQHLPQPLSTSLAAYRQAPIHFDKAPSPFNADKEIHSEWGGEILVYKNDEETFRKHGKKGVRKLCPVFCLQKRKSPSLLPYQPERHLHARPIIVLFVVTRVDRFGLYPLCLLPSPHQRDLVCKPPFMLRTTPISFNKTRCSPHSALLSKTRQPLLPKLTTVAVNNTQGRSHLRTRGVLGPP